MGRSAPSLVVAVAITLVVAMALFFLSSGPVLAYHAEHPDANSVRVCRLYRPLFCACSRPLADYANWCGASDIEIFLLIHGLQDQM